MHIGHRISELEGTLAQHFPKCVLPDILLLCTWETMLLPSIFELPRTHRHVEVPEKSCWKAEP